MRALVTRLLALVFVLVGLLANTNAGAVTKADPAWTLPSDCALMYADKIGDLLRFIDDQGQTKSYTCSTDNRTYTVDISYIMAAILEVKGVYRQQQITTGGGYLAADNTMSLCRMGGQIAPRLGIFEDSPAYSYGYDPHAYGFEPNYGPDVINSGAYPNRFPNKEAGIQWWEKYLNDNAKLSKAFLNMPPCWMQKPFVELVRQQMAQGVRRVDGKGLPCTTIDCADTSDPGTGGGDTGGSGGTTSPACTLPNGTTSGNPYDCAPDNAETNCKIIDIFCAVKKAFIPSPDFMSKGYFNYAAEKAKLPIRATDKIEFDSTSIFGKLSIDFTTLLGKDNATVNMILKLIAWYQILFFGLNYLGLPNPFGSNRGGGSSAVGEGVDYLRSRRDGD